MVVRKQWSGLLGAMKGHRDAAGLLANAVDHYVKVSRGYWRGLFDYSNVADVPRTNNGLEQTFGSYRYHERRATGRKGASPTLLLHGCVRLVAGLATRHREVVADELAGADGARWLQLRAELGTTAAINRMLRVPPKTVGIPRKTRKQTQQATFAARVF